MLHTSVRTNELKIGSRPRSSSTGVELSLHGWRPGFDKVRFTRLLRGGGRGPGEAVEPTGRLLVDQEISVRFRQFEDRHAAACVLADMGVTHVA